MNLYLKTAKQLYFKDIAIFTIFSVFSLGVLSCFFALDFNLLDHVSISLISRFDNLSLFITLLHFLEKPLILLI